MKWDYRIGRHTSGASVPCHFTTLLTHYISFVQTFGLGAAQHEQTPEGHCTRPRNRYITPHKTTTENMLNYWQCAACMQLCGECTQALRWNCKNCLSFVIRIRYMRICGELDLHLSVDSGAKKKKIPLQLIPLDGKTEAKLLRDMTSFLVAPSTALLREDIFSQCAYWIFGKLIVL